MQFSVEDKNLNCLRESLDLFELIIKYPWFKEAVIVLFLNKTDLFEDKISKVHLGDFFPEFTGTLLSLYIKLF